MFIERGRRKQRRRHGHQWFSGDEATTAVGGRGNGSARLRRTCTYPQLGERWTEEVTVFFSRDDSGRRSPENKIPRRGHSSGSSSTIQDKRNPRDSPERSEELKDHRRSEAPREGSLASFGAGRRPEARLSCSITQKKNPTSTSLSIPAQISPTPLPPLSPHRRRLHLPPPPHLIPSPPLIRRRSGARTTGSLISHGGGGEVHEGGVRRARSDGGGGVRVEEGLAAAIWRFRRALRQVRGITCLYVDVPDCEIIIWSQMNPVCTLLGFPTGDMTIILLYEAPVGIAIFSFDGDYLNDPAKDF
ncbi:uncharacterized protein [Triticum aestivum]|uniref:uncharacterized protein n=1 Tax=Triticum aestivum TaxID=4565 RepID=UPI001D0259BF|nr:uncharacterized protein LOC123114796 [Triticum aestivum]